MRKKRNYCIWWHSIFNVNQHCASMKMKRSRTIMKKQASKLKLGIDLWNDFRQEQPKNERKEVFFILNQMLSTSQTEHPNQLRGQILIFFLKNFNFFYRKKETILFALHEFFFSMRCWCNVFSVLFLILIIIPLSLHLFDFKRLFPFISLVASIN